MLDVVDILLLAELTADHRRVLAVDFKIIVVDNLADIVPKVLATRAFSPLSSRHFPAVAASIGSVQTDWAGVAFRHQLTPFHP